MLYYFFKREEEEDNVGTLVHFENNPHSNLHGHLKIYLAVSTLRYVLRNQPNECLFQSKIISQKVFSTFQLLGIIENQINENLFLNQPKF